MKMPYAVLIRFAICISVLTALPSSAFLSGDERNFGPDRAKTPLNAFESDNEHGRLLYEAMQMAGIPLPIYRVEAQFTANHWIEDDDVPADFRTAEIPAAREYTISGMAGLPDHSYSLWDWAGANSICPLGARPADPVLCHKFATHMGAVNANHFLPMSQLTYAHYHSLAKQRAMQCAVLAQNLNGGSLGPDIDRAEFIKECEREAMLFEAFGQHFLQDSWAVGHMWHRWGSPLFENFRQEGQSDTHTSVRAFLVSLGAGMIHGSEGLLKSIVPFAPGDDLSSNESGEIEFITVGGVFPGIGDLHADSVLKDEQYIFQKNRLLQCSVFALREVYGLTARVSGDLEPSEIPNNPIVAEAQLLGEECFAQRVTNDSMAEAVGLSYLPDALVYTYVVGLLPFFSGVPGVSVADEYVDLVDEFRIDMLFLLSVPELLNFADPDSATSTTFASGAFPFDDFMDVEENALFPYQSLFTDPALDANQVWPIDKGGEESRGRDRDDARPTRIISRLFHQAHVDGWCVDEEAAPDELKAAYLAAQMSGSPTAEARQQACIEFARRHIFSPDYVSVCAAVAPLNSVQIDGGNWGFDQGVSDTSTLALNYCTNSAPESDSPTLNSLSLTDVVLTPAFAPSVLAYAATVPFTTTETMVTAVATEASDSISINGSAAQSGVPFGPVALRVGNNQITIVVSNVGNESTQYQIDVVREELPIGAIVRIDFDDLPSGTLVTQQYRDFGLSVDASPRTTAGTIGSNPPATSFGNSGPNAMWPGGGSCCTLLLGFNRLVPSFSFRAGNGDVGPTVIGWEVFGPNLELLESSTTEIAEQSGVTITLHSDNFGGTLIRAVHLHNGPPNVITGDAYVDDFEYQYGVP